MTLGVGRISFPGGSEGKTSAYNAGDLGSIPGAGRSPGEGGLAGRDKGNFLHIMTPSSSLVFPGSFPQGSRTGLGLSPKLFLSFLF